MAETPTKSSIAKIVQSAQQLEQSVTALNAAIRPVVETNPPPQKKTRNVVASARDLSVSLASLTDFAQKYTKE